MDKAYVIVLYTRFPWRTRTAGMRSRMFSRFGRDYITVSDYVNQIFPFLGIRFISVKDCYDSANMKGKTSGVDCMKGSIKEYKIAGVVLSIIHIYIKVLLDPKDLLIKAGSNTGTSVKSCHGSRLIWSGRQTDWKPSLPSCKLNWLLPSRENQSSCYI